MAARGRGAARDWALRGGIWREATASGDRREGGGRRSRGEEARRVRADCDCPEGGLTVPAKPLRRMERPRRRACRACFLLQFDSNLFFRIKRLLTRAARARCAAGGGCRLAMRST